MNPPADPANPGPEPRKPAAFERPAFVSEEVWNRTFPAHEDTVADSAEVEAELDRLAQADGVSRRFPWATFALVLLNLLVFVAGIGGGLDPFAPDAPSLVPWGANNGPMVMTGQWWRLCTCMFLHVGLVHLICNMLVLWFIGDFTERLLGRAGLLVIYLVAGLGASLASIAWNPVAVSAGASGAIFGLYGALLGFLAQESHSVPNKVRNRLALNAVFFVAYNLLHGAHAEGVDLGAHLGGLGTGFICGLFIALPATPEGRARRPAVNLRVLGVGLGLVAIVTFFLPRFSGPAGSFARAGMSEKRALAAFESAAAKVRAGTLSDAQFADRIDQEVVPDLEDCRTRLEALVEAPRYNPDKLRAMVKFTEAREAAYAHMAQALRSGDSAAANAALQENAAALRNYGEAMNALAH
jgi:membrane associated rhomboid family serine protease